MLPVARARNALTDQPCRIEAPRSAVLSSTPMRWRGSSTRAPR